MDDPNAIDSQIVLLQDFETEDRDDSRNLRWSLLAALTVHATLLTVALPASEAIDESHVVACSFRPAKQIYARSARGMSQSGAVPRTVPPAMERRTCNLFSDPPLEDTSEPILEAELEELDLILELAPRPRSTPPSRAFDLGITPQLIACVEPQWTEVARRARLQGAVILEIVIQEDGTVTEPKVLKPLPFGLDEAAVEAVALWRYEPIEVEGKLVALRHVVAVHFQPGKSNCPTGTEPTT